MSVFKIKLAGQSVLNQLVAAYYPSVTEHPPTSKVVGEAAGANIHTLAAFALNTPFDPDIGVLANVTEYK